MKKIIDECYAEAKRLILENKEVLHRCASLLLEKERITREEFESLFKTTSNLSNVGMGLV